jgi:hypothetical protein
MVPLLNLNLSISSKSSYISNVLVLSLQMRSLLIALYSFLEPQVLFFKLKMSTYLYIHVKYLMTSVQFMLCNIFVDSLYRSAHINSFQHKKIVTTMFYVKRYRMLEVRRAMRREQKQDLWFQERILIFFTQ